MQMIMDSGVRVLPMRTVKLLFYCGSAMSMASPLTSGDTRLLIHRVVFAGRTVNIFIHLFRCFNGNLAMISVGMQLCEYGSKL